MNRRLSQANTNESSRPKQPHTLIDVRVLDHLIIGDGTQYSFTQTGLL